LAQKVVASVIAGATSSRQVNDNAAAATWTLTADDLEEIDTALRGGSAINR
jgi:aryl-alcohol dehydrogenase-like predicted oxidoreductase